MYYDTTIMPSAADMLGSMCELIKMMAVYIAIKLRFLLLKLRIVNHDGTSKLFCLYSFSCSP